jgi:hypothetical protein
VQIGDLLLYNQDGDAIPTDAVKRLKAEIADACSVLFVTAEYIIARFQGRLENAINHAARPCGRRARANDRYGAWVKRHVA